MHLKQYEINIICKKFGFISGYLKSVPESFEFSIKYSQLWKFDCASPTTPIEDCTFEFLSEDFTRYLYKNFIIKGIKEK